MDATLLTLFRNGKKEFKETLLRKTRDSNVLKTTRADGNVKTIEIQRMHTSIYNAIFLQRNTEDVSCKTFADVYNVLGDSTLRTFRTRDLCLVTPWATLLEDMGVGFEKGKFVIPITKGAVATVCFVPCSGIDDETGEEPIWCDEVSLKQFAAFNWAVFTNLQTVAKNRVDILANDNITDVLPGEVMVGDIVTVGGQANEVLSVGDSGKYANGEIVVCKDKWKRRGNQRKLSVTRVPTLYGKMMAIQNEKLQSFADVNFSLTKVNENNYGTLICTYRQGGFNCFGFSVYELFD